MKNFFDENLRDDETYFDFTNQSLFFAATGRKNPIYINQCPAMINGVKGQLQALNRLKNNPKVKFVVMPNAPYIRYTQIDGILNCDRYYLLTEWICENYQPYKQVGDFYVWQQKTSDTAELPNYNYELPENHFHNLGYIPYLVGQSSVESKTFEISSTLKNVRGKVGFITLEISADDDSEVQIRLTGDGVNDVAYQFKLAKGTHIYRLRASSDILWYSDKIETLEVGNLAVNKIYFEEISE